MVANVTPRLVVLLIAVLLFAGLPVAQPQAVAQSPWTLPGDGAVPPAPWLVAGSPAAADEDVALLEVPVAADSFTSDFFPHENLGRFTSVWFGTDPELGTMRAYLRWNAPRLPGVFAGAAIYLPIAGTTVEQPMTARAFKLTASWDEDSVPAAGVNPNPIATFTIPAPPGWVYFDVTQLVRDMYEGRYYWNSIQLRGSEDGSQVAKAMYSREAGADKPVATLVIAYRPDRAAPTCTLAALPPVSGAKVSLRPTCVDDPLNTTGVEEIEYEMRTSQGQWTALYTRPANTYSEDVDRLQGGQTYSFRVRARDFAGNFSPWTSDNAAVTTIETVPPTIRPGQLYDMRWYPQSDMWRYLGGAVDAYDPGPPSSGLGASEYRYSDGSATWKTVTNWDNFVFETGKHYSFQMRAVDQAGNKSAWLSFGPVTVVKKVIYGSIADAYDRGVNGLPLVLDPAPANKPVITTESGFAAYTYSTGATTIRPAASQFVLYPDVPAPAEEGDTWHQKRWLYPLRNAVVNGDFQSPLAAPWQSTGAVELVPGPLAASTLAARFDASKGAASLKQTLVVPAEVVSPTLSFWGWPSESAYLDRKAHFTVTLTEPGKTPLTIFDHAIEPWYAPSDLLPSAFDLTPWAGKTVTISFNFATGDSVTAFYLLDEVRVSPLPVDMAVRLSPASARPAGGETVSFSLRVSNRRGPETPVPVRIVWPEGWTLVSSEETPEETSGTGMTLRFRLVEGQEQVARFVLRAPKTPVGVRTEVRAELPSALAGQDFVPADNAWTALLLPGGQASWLPLVAP